MSYTTIWVEPECPQEDIDFLNQQTCNGHTHIYKISVEANSCDPV